MTCILLIIGAWLVALVVPLALIIGDILGDGKLCCKPIFATFDCWIGFYWDRKNRMWYFFPVPMFGFKMWAGDRRNHAK